jgi:hypothetical protein
MIATLFFLVRTTIEVCARTVKGFSLATRIYCNRKKVRNVPNVPPLKAADKIYEGDWTVRARNAQKCIAFQFCVSFFAVIAAVVL